MREIAQKRPRENGGHISTESLRTFYVQSWNVATAIQTMCDIRLRMIDQLENAYGNFSHARKKSGVWTRKNEQWLGKQLSRINARRRIIIQRRASMVKWGAVSLARLKKVKDADFDNLADTIEQVQSARETYKRTEGEYRRAKKEFYDLIKRKKIKKSDQKAFWESSLRMVEASRNSLSSNLDAFGLHGLTLSSKTKNEIHREIRFMDRLMTGIRRYIQELDGNDEPPQAFI